MKNPNSMNFLRVLASVSGFTLLSRIAGLVRADDIATDNTVASTRIANARITYSGTGSFADASQPGWLDRFFMSPMWPF